MPAVSIPVLRFQDFVAADGEQLTTTSLKVAQVFGKRHDNVLRDIRELISELPEDRRLNFEGCLRINDLANGKQEPYFVMTRYGFTWLAMRFRGARALAFQVAYTDAFNAMAALLKNQREGLSYRRAKFELEEKDSQRRGSFHGRGLNARKLEIPGLAAEGRALLALSQPQLPGIVVVLTREAEAAPPAGPDATLMVH